MKHSFMFVCQQGPLEFKSMLLAASLRRYLNRKHELIAVLPKPRWVWGHPSDRTLSFLREMGVRLVPILNRINVDYPIGNKMSCFNIKTAGAIRVFLDSDILCLQPFPGLEHSMERFGAKPADFNSCELSEVDWAKLYSTQGLPAPKDKVQCTVSKMWIPPYFNAGFVAVRNCPGFGPSWTRICRDIYNRLKGFKKRRCSDQISLPMVLKKLEIKYSCLDESFNYPSHVRLIDATNPPFFAHYHSPKRLKRDPILHETVHDLVRVHKTLHRTFVDNPKWKMILNGRP